METLKRQHKNFNTALTALIVVPMILSFVMEFMVTPPRVLVSLVAIVLTARVIKHSSSRYKSAKDISEKLPAGRGREAFLAYATNAKRCGWVVLVCFLAGVVANIISLFVEQSVSFELLFLARVIIFALLLLAIIDAAIETGKHFRNLPNVDADLPKSETENSEGKN